MRLVIEEGRRVLVIQGGVERFFLNLDPGEQVEIVVQSGKGNGRELAREPFRSRLPNEPGMAFDEVT